MEMWKEKTVAEKPSVTCGEAEKQPAVRKRRMLEVKSRGADAKGNRRFKAVKPLSMDPLPMGRTRTHIPLLWIVMVIFCVGIIALVEQFWIRPLWTASVVQVPLPPLGDKLEPLGMSCQAPKGLHEVVPAYLPVLTALAPGGVAAVQRQLDASGSLFLPVEAVNSIGMRFRLIPAGDCQVGSPVSESGHHQVESRHLASFLEPFYLGVTEVTQGQWKAVMGAESNPSHFKGDDLPVEEVSWLQCQEFLRRLNEQEGLDKHTYRLPTEFQWEYACRGGSETAYCFGDDVSRLGDWAVYSENARRTSPVGQKLPNAFGLYDMHGNVWEWCQNFYRNYPGDMTPLSSVNGYRCIRGGNWYVSAIECRSANRCRLPDRSAGNMLGFRVLRIIEPVH